MEEHQTRSGDIVDLTAAGIAEIKGGANEYTEINRPIHAKERRWSAWTLNNVWVGILVSVLVYQVSAGFIALGMAWYAAVATVMIGHGLVMVVAVALGHFGTKYGLPFPLLSKLIFGQNGAILPNVVRGLLGAFWFAIQTWIGGQALDAIITNVLPAWENTGFWGTFSLFVIFGFINIYVVAKGMRGIKYLENWMAPVLVVMCFVVLIWAMVVADWNFGALVSSPELAGNTESGAWSGFLPALSAMIAFDGAIVLSIADLTRECKNQRSQILGQVLGAPLLAGFIGFVGVAGTGAGVLAFGEVIWNPALLLARFDNTFVVLIFSLVIVGSIITTNVAGNLVPPANIVANTLSRAFAERKLPYWASVTIAALVGLFSFPWLTANNPESLIQVFLVYLGAALGPLSGVMMAGYLLQHRNSVDLVALFRLGSGKYYYKHGWNLPPLIICLVSTALIIVCGFIPGATWIFGNSFTLGLIVNFVIYGLVILSDRRNRLDDPPHQSTGSFRD
jgi:NCS1 family nucleobase:cation symporter-1